MGAVALVITDSLEVPLYYSVPFKALIFLVLVAAKHFLICFKGWGVNIISVSAIADLKSVFNFINVQI